MICLDCAHLDLKRQPAHAKLGLGQCKVNPGFGGEFQNFTINRNCERSHMAPPDMRKARAAWWGKLSKETT